MRTFLRQLRPAVVALLVFTALLGVVYPLAVTGVAQVAFRHRANGSLVEADGHVVGSALLGQQFAAAGYFHSRPSAAGDGYDGASSGASNLGPSNTVLIDAVAERVQAYRTENGLPEGYPVPVDAVTASASGLDPQISLANARLQAGRVAQARSLDLGSVQRLVGEHTSERPFGVLGDPGVNVLELNIALDRLK